MPSKSKIYTDPELAPSSLLQAPTIAVLPDMETELPKISADAASDAVIFVSVMAKAFSAGNEILRIKIPVIIDKIVNLLVSISYRPSMMCISLI